MNDQRRDEEAERKKFEEEYLLSKKPIEYLERLKREFDKARFKELRDKEKDLRVMVAVLNVF